MKKRAIWAVLLLGLVYFGTGMVFGTLAGRAASMQERQAWRLGAWVVSAIAFGAHIVYEQVQLRSAPRLSALRVSLAAGLGAFGLAAAATLHARQVSPDRHSLLLGLSLAIWPIITALPAFVVALIAALLLGRVRRSAMRGS
jgi:hypothetical protein